LGKVVAMVESGFGWRKTTKFKHLSCASLANLAAVEVILVPLVILAGFRPSKRGREAMSGK